MTMIVVGGENLIDFVQSGDGQHGPLYHAIPGGSPFNCAMAIARQGQKVGYLTPISSDALGRLLAGRLEEDGVALLAPRRPEPSSLAVVSLTDGQATYGFYRDSTAERQITSDTQLPKEATAFHVGSLALIDGADAEHWEALHNAASSAGLFTTLDPNLRPLMVKERAPYQARLERLFETVDLLKLSDEDLAWLMPDASFDEAVDALRARTKAGLMVVTKGAEGAIGLTQSARVVAPSRPADPLVDTVGAGDTFMATLIATCSANGWTSKEALSALSETDLTALLHRAGTAASLNCERAGCQPPSSQELTAAL
ncbi:MAG: carbohydrate kinase [Pseudomonadota bacterium]